MGAKADGYRLIKEYNFKYDQKLTTKTIYETQIKTGIYFISLEDMEEANKVAEARGYYLKDIIDEFGSI